MALTLHYNFQDNPGLDAVANPEGGTLGPTLVSTNTSDATVRDLDNVLRTVPASSGDGRFTGQRYVRNRQLYSQDGTNGWIQNEVTVAADDTTAPDGTVTADKLTENTANNFHRIYYGITPNPEAAHTFSAYLKKGSGRDWCWLRLQDAAGAVRLGFFNLATGVVGDLDTGLTGAMEDVGDGWYRCWISLDPVYTAGTLYTGIGLADADLSATYTGDGASYMYFWGAQLENVAGQLDPAPSEYQATTTAAVGKWYNTRRRTNLFATSEPTVADCGTSNNLTDAGTPISGFDNSIYFLDDALTRNFNNPGATFVHVPGTTYTISAYVEMDDGSQPVFSTAGDIQFIVNNVFPAAPHTYENVYGNVWRVSVAQTVTSPVVNNAGMYKYSASSSKGLKVSGLQIEKGSTVTPYIKTTDKVASSVFHSPAGLYTESTNLCTYSEDTAQWTTTTTTRGADATTDPNGTSTADAMVEDGTTTAPSIYRAAMTAVAGQVYCWSAYVKVYKGSTRWVGIVPQATGTLSRVYWDISNDQAANVHTAPDVGYGIEDVGGGWYRIWITDVATASGTMYHQINLSEDGSAGTYATSTANGVYIWGMMVEDVTSAFYKGPSTYIPTTGVAVTEGRYEPSPGWLMEFARTNLIPRSQELDVWANLSNLTIDADVATAPDGTATADRLNLTAGGKGYAYNGLQTVTASTNYAQSVFLKADGGRYVILNRTLSLNKWISIVADLEDGVITHTGVGSASGTLTDYGIEDWGNGWYRVWMVGYTSDVSGACAIKTCNAAVPTFDSYGGQTHTQVEGEDFFAWGAQLELGAFLTSYIPTAAASVTRTQDFSVTPGAEDYLNDNAGTLYIDCSTELTTGADFLAVSKDAGLDALATLAINGSKPRFIYYGSGAYSADIRPDTPIFVSDRYYKHVGAYAEDDFAVSVDGEDVSTDTSGALTAGLNTIEVYTTGASGGNHGYIREIKYYDERLDDATLEAFSQGTDPDVSYTYAGDLDLGDSDWWRRRRILRRQRMLQFRRR